MKKLILCLIPGLFFVSLAVAKEAVADSRKLPCLYEIEYKLKPLTDKEREKIDLYVKEYGMLKKDVWFVLVKSSGDSLEADIFFKPDKNSAMKGEVKCLTYNANIPAEIHYAPLDKMKTDRVPSLKDVPFEILNKVPKKKAFSAVRLVKSILKKGERIDRVDYLSKVVKTEKQDGITIITKTEPVPGPRLVIHTSTSKALMSGRGRIITIDIVDGKLSIIKIESWFS